MLRLQFLSSSFLSPLNPEFSPNSSHRTIYSFNPSLPHLTLTTSRKSSLKSQYSSWNSNSNSNPNSNPSHIFEPSSPTPTPTPTPSHSFSRAGAPGALPPRFFVGHSIYKGKAALTVEPKPPEFTPLDSGAFKLSREGFVLLQFAPSAAVRQYDWTRKQVFSLSVTEIGSLVALGPKESCEFFHDPFKGKSEEGKVRKILKVEPLPDGSGHFFNLSVQNKLINMDESIYIPITKAEYAVLVSAFNFILPYLLGWHAFANSTKPEDNSRVNNANPKYGGDFEWSR